MRIPEVDVQEPVILCAAALQPVDRHGRHVISPVAAAEGGVVNLVEIRVPVPSRMPVAERADGRGVQPGIAQAADPAGPAQGRLRGPAGALDKRIAGRAAVVDDTGMDPHPPAEQTRAARGAWCVGDENIVEAHALSRDAIDVWAGGAVIAVAAQVVRAQ